jgi:spore germination protein YaaH
MGIDSTRWVQALVLLVGLSLSVTLEVRADSDAPVSFLRSVGHQDLIDPADKGIRQRPLFPAEAAPVEAASAPGPVVNREVIGYLPYWEMDYEIKHWQYLTILAWFAVGMDSNGDPTDYHGWGGPSTESLVNEAHAHGVKVIVTITNFSNGEIGTLLKSPAKRQNAIDTCLELIAVHQVDGVNIDFEFVPASAKSDFVTFMADLKDAVTAVQPNGSDGHVSLAGPSVDWDGAYDYDQLLVHSDGIMVMAYGYHWGGGNPGPVAPLHGGGKWPDGKNSIAWTIDDYLKWGGEANRHRIYIGLPWYGREWTVANAGVPGTSLGDSKAVIFATAKKQAAQEGKQYDNDTETAYYHINHDSSLWQVWFDDGQGFDAKVAYIVDNDLGGLGIWALGYDGGHDDLWDGIANNMVGDVPGPGPEADPSPESDPELSGEDVFESDITQEEVIETSDAGPDEDVDASGQEVDGTVVDLGPSTPPSAKKPQENTQLATGTTSDKGCGISPQPSSPIWVFFTLFFLFAMARSRFRPSA